MHDIDPPFGKMERELYTPLDTEAIKAESLRGKLVAEQVQIKNTKRFLEQEWVALDERDSQIDHLLGNDLTGSAYDLNLQDPPRFNPRGLFRNFKSKFK